MSRESGWWVVEEQSSRPEGLFGAIRRWWNGVLTREYVWPLVERQNRVNRRLAEALTDAEETIVALDRELADARRLHAQAVYELREELTHLAARVAVLEAALGHEEDAA